MSFPTKSIFASKYPVYLGRSHNQQCANINGFTQKCGRNPTFKNIYASSLIEANQSTGYQNAAFAAMDSTNRHNYRTLPSSSGANIILVEYTESAAPVQSVAATIGGRRRRSHRKKTVKKSRRNRRRTYKKH